MGGEVEETRRRKAGDWTIMRGEGKTRRRWKGIPA